MNTQPFEKLLNRSIGNEESILLDSSVAPLEETINYGSQLFNNTILKGKKIFPFEDNEHDFIIAMLFRYAIDAAESICVLLLNKCVDPSKILIRSLLESSAYLEYMLSSNTRDKAAAYMIFDYIRMIKECNAYDSETAEGKNHKAAIKNEKYLGGLELTNNPEIIKKKQELIETLNSERYSKVYSMYKERKKVRHWYSIVEDIGTFKSLMEKLNSSALYLLYQSFSTYTHPSNIIQGKVNFNDGKQSIRSIRDPRDFQKVRDMTITLLLKAYESSIRFYDESQLRSFGLWYTNNVHQQMKETVIETN